jgi:broad specificity phosphatase PhoE
MIRIILIRHGRTAWNVSEGQGQRFRGIIDLPLADEGITQAQMTAQRLADLPLTAVYSSPLQRSARTAEIIAKAHSLVAQSLPGLSTMNYGAWAGRLHADVARLWPNLYRQWRYDPFSVQIPGGESIRDLRERAFTALHQALAHHADGETIALVSHQAVTKTLSCVLAGLPNTGFWRIRQDLCNLTLFDYNPADNTFSLAGLNDTCHLTTSPLAPSLPSRKDGGCRILLIRHGQTAWNEGASPSGTGERFRGRTDLPLDTVGQAQAHALATRLADEPIAAIYASPLLRARQTITPLATGRSLPTQSHESLLDIDYGRFQGLTHSEAKASYPELYAAWRKTPDRVRFPGGEGLSDVKARLQALLDDLVARHRGQTVTLVGHQIVNKVLACMLLDLDLDRIWRIRQDTTGINVFQQADDLGPPVFWHTLCLNDTCHLAPVRV